MLFLPLVRAFPTPPRGFLLQSLRHRPLPAGIPPQETPTAQNLVTLDLADAHLAALQQLEAPQPCVIAFDTGERRGMTPQVLPRSSR